MSPILRQNAVAHRLQDLAGRPAAGENIILDCTDSDRLGLRGPGTMEWLAAEGIAAPEINTTLTLPNGTAVLRLGQQEVLLLSVPGSEDESPRRRWNESPLAAKGYDACRDAGWAWFVISGPDAPALMPRISMTDLHPRSFGLGRLAQTRALHMDAVVARSDRFGAVSYDLFFDIAAAAFAIDVLEDTSAGLVAEGTQGFRLARPVRTA
ncbi:hypothetical protein D2T31_18335 [Sinirhodobacter populi]|uniref:Sarcosine oxidase n=1 Tax=Paenirhodobacter populi TaxID=2306993 RepID=A0A443K2G2_9RHOB|nr:hypothetical protein [Sinirhodobacter populi]RWR26935.1 hypothetical protein D2T31_18335 [Sinirhodobacter populi]